LWHNENFLPLPPCSAAEFRGIMARRTSANSSSTHFGEYTARRGKSPGKN
jgi:hypothetical protein